VPTQDNNWHEKVLVFLSCCFAKESACLTISVLQKITDGCLDVICCFAKVQEPCLIAIFM
jgi:hypothetical protein